MNFRSHTFPSDSVYRAVSTIMCILFNVALAFLTRKLGLPLYFDSVGIILMSFLGGSFSGIVTAVATNVLCCLFNPESLYFTLVGVLIALAAAAVTRNEAWKNWKRLPVLVIILSLISGGLGGVIQWLIFKQPQFSYVSETASMVSRGNGFLYALLSILLVIGLNFVDKTLSTVLALAAFHVIPGELRQEIRSSGWVQKPLTQGEVRTIDRLNRGKGSSVKVRLAAMMITAITVLTMVLAYVSLVLNYDTAKKGGRETVQSAAGFAAKYLNADSLRLYLSEGKAVPFYSNPSYRKSNEFLRQLRDSYPNIEYLYVYEIREDGCYTVFDTDEEFQKHGIIGSKEEFDETFLEYVPALLKGEQIPVLEVTSSYGYYITAYEPVMDTRGNPSSFYVGADVRQSRFTEDMWELIIKMALVFSGFFFLVIASVLWISGHYLVYPIGSLERSVDGFMEGIEDQEKLDESVKKLESLDIRTNDELEKLYKSVCEMAVGAAEQMRSIRLLAKANEKMQSGLIITMADMVESRDSDTGAHVQKTAAYVRIILEGLKRKGYYAEKLTDKYMKDVEMSAPLHDVGKINVPDSVLNKPGKLSEEEFEIMKTHTTAGKKILENAISTVQGENYLKEARNMAAYHHERWDGKGYPEGLHGQVIPLSARVMAVADVFDALTSPRVYKPAFPLEKALAIIREGAGSQFDPKCVEVFMEALPEVKKILKKYNQL